jgi:CxxC-x17-CxxC domain-containing protein
MKKNFKRHISGGSSSGAGPDTDNLLYKINQRLEFLEKKIDMLVNRSSTGDIVSRARAPLVPSRGQERYGFHRERSDSFSEKREFTKVQCAGCGNECEVPFKPTGDRPVYCRVCFAKQKDNFPAKEKFNRRGKPEFHYKQNR